MITSAMAASEKLTVSREKIRHALMPVTRSTGEAAQSTARATVLSLLEPYAQSNPFTLVTGAFVAGGLLACSKPSRGAFATVLVKEVVPRLAPAFVAAHFPVGWTDLLGAVLHSADKPGP